MSPKIFDVAQYLIPGLGMKGNAILQGVAQGQFSITREIGPRYLNVGFQA